MFWHHPATLIDLIGMYMTQCEEYIKEPDEKKAKKLFYILDEFMNVYETEPNKEHYRSYLENTKEEYAKLYFQTKTRNLPSIF